MDKNKGSIYFNHEGNKKVKEKKQIKRKAETKGNCNYINKKKKFQKNPINLKRWSFIFLFRCYFYAQNKLNLCVGHYLNCERYYGKLHSKVYCKTYSKNWKLRLWKQLSRGVLKKKCCENMQQNYRRTPLSKCDLQSNFIEITRWHGCSPVNLLHNFRTSFSKNNSGSLLLRFLKIWLIVGPHKQTSKGTLHERSATLWKRYFSTRVFLWA